MYEVLLSCVRCDEQLEVIVVSLDEAEAIACDCGDGWTIESIAEYEAWRRPPRLRSVEPPAADERLPRAA